MFKITSRNTHLIIISPEKKKINILMQISLKKYAELRRPFGWNFIKMMNITIGLGKNKSKN
ncbi:hypothetical protein DW843_09595 [Ruminococcus sp. AM36-18]|nr:hypothetical protein DW843_09595 [Ruminococcus sp. AM36-18]